MPKPNLKSRKNYLIQTAWERQKLGLTLTEYNALTPFEISCELEALAIIDKQKEQHLKILDVHLARISIMLNGFNFPDLKACADFMILKDGKNSSKKTRGKNTTKNFEMLARMEELKKKIRARREELRARKI